MMNIPLLQIQHKGYFNELMAIGTVTGSMLSIDDVDTDKATTIIDNFYGRKSVGLGDTVAKVAHKIGIDKIADAYTNHTGRDCGCGKRQQILNKLVPYKS